MHGYEGQENDDSWQKSDRIWRNHQQRREPEQGRCSNPPRDRCAARRSGGRVAVDQAGT
jgi:hypothetical protein